MDNQDNQPEPTQPGTSAPGSASEPGKEEKNWGMFAHLSALSGFVIPFGNLLGPFIIWQIRKDDMPFAAEQAKEALNFQITVSIAVVVCILLTFVLIGALLLPLVGIIALVLTIIAGIKANDGEHYQYPLTWRLIS